MLLIAGLFALMQQAAAAPPPQRLTVWSGMTPAQAAQRRPRDGASLQPVPTVVSTGSVLSDRGSGFVLQIPLLPEARAQGGRTTADVPAAYFRGARVCLRGEIRSTADSVTSWVWPRNGLRVLAGTQPESLGKPGVWTPFAIEAIIPLDASEVNLGFHATGTGRVETRGVRLIKESDWIKPCHP